MTASAWPTTGVATLSSGEEIEVVREIVPIGASGIEGIEIERPRDPASLIQDWCNRADLSAPIPYWAEIWPASRAIARRLAVAPPIDGLEVLDLGCGLGLAGIAAARRGGRVSFADNHPDALAFARRNALSAGALGTAFLLADWRDPVWAHPFDLVLGADVIYDRMEHEAIADLLERLLAGGGTAWMGDPCRDIARPFLEGWVEGGRGVRVTEKVEPLPGEDVASAIHELRLA